MSYSNTVLLLLPYYVTYNRYLLHISMYYIVYNDINVYKIVNMYSDINRLKEEIYGESSFNHNQHSFMIKILTFLGI